MKHYSYISCLLSPDGELGMEYIPLFNAEEVDFFEAMIETIQPKLFGFGLEESDNPFPGVGVYTYEKQGEEGSLFVCIVTDEKGRYDDDGFMTYQATVFATTHEFDELGLAIEAWLKSLE